MARLPRLSVANYPHHIIQRGNNRQVICADEADFEQLLTLLREAAQRHRVALYSWVLLPEQMQIIATPETAEGVPRMMQDMGRAYVRYFNNRYVRTGTLWEGRYRNTVLDPERVVAAMVCLDWLPVHRQLAEQPRDWAWSSSAFYSGHKHMAGVTMPPQVWRLGNTPFARESAWQALLDSPYAFTPFESLQEHAWHGWVQGGLGFVKELQEISGRRLQKSNAGRPAKLQKIPE